MSKAQVQKGDVVEFAAPYDRNSGQFALLNAALGGVAQVNILSGVVGPFARYGVHTLDKATGETWAIGDVLYWDNTAKKFTKTSTSNTKWGIAMSVTLSADTSGNVLLSGNG